MLDIPLAARLDCPMRRVDRSADFRSFSGGLSAAGQEVGRASRTANAKQFPDRMRFKTVCFELVSALATLTDHVGVSSIGLIISWLSQRRPKFRPSPRN